MRVLVTGGAGFIGSNFVHALAGEHQVGVIDDLSTGSAANLHPGAWFRRMDVLDAGLGDAVRAFGPDAVVHLAAQVSVAESFRDPERDWAVNVEGTRAVAAAARAAGARRFLSASSAAVYGPPGTLPLPETAVKAPANPYGASKLAAEAALAECLSGTDVDLACLRFSNVYGPRQDWRGEGGVVAVFISRAVAGEPMTIFGDGRQTRDFIYVGDVVACLRAALDAARPLAAEGPDGPAYNVSTGQETSVMALLAAVRDATGYAGETLKGPLPEGDVPRSSLDPAKIRAATAWSAVVPIEKGMAATARWFEST